LKSVDTASNESAFTAPVDAVTAACGSGGGGDSGGKKHTELKQIEKEIVTQGAEEGIAKVASLGLEGALVALAVPLNGPSATEYVGYTLHTDHLGSVRLITDAAAKVVSRHVYFPFGQEVGPIVRTPSSHKFTGHERDLDTGLDYMLARYYSAGLSRFMSVDPNPNSVELQNPQTWNKYSYVANNPILYNDPRGECFTPACIGEIAAGATLLAIAAKFWLAAGENAKGLEAREQFNQGMISDNPEQMIQAREKQVEAIQGVTGHLGEAGLMMEGAAIGAVAGAAEAPEAEAVKAVKTAVDVISDVKSVADSMKAASGNKQSGSGAKQGGGPGNSGSSNGGSKSLDPGKNVSKDQRGALTLQEVKDKSSQFRR
jgi:RHS repeat-associated protein